MTRETLKNRWENRGILSKDAVAFDVEGYRVGENIQVRSFSGGTVSIAGASHRKNELEIDLEKGEITSRLAGWSVLL